jgi:3-hydroxy-5-phosphonooxypentane-2,4-dione thiolase
MLSKHQFSYNNIYITKKRFINMDLKSLNLGWGKKNRLAQLFKNDSGDYRTVMLAIDHPYFQGPIRGLEDPGNNIQPLLLHADAVSPARGSLEYALDPLDTTPIVLRVSGGNSLERKKHLSEEIITTTIEEALKLNASAVSVSVYIGSKHQQQTIGNLANLVNEASKYNLPVLGITAVGAELEEKVKSKDSDYDKAWYFAQAGRILQEEGADIVKTYFVENFEKIRNGIQVPIVIAGGTQEKENPEKKAMIYAYNSIQGGADGMDMGRNIFQSENPLDMIYAIKKIVHENYSSDDAFEKFETSINKK